MGRALFSTYVAAPVVRTEPEPKVDICERYSSWNRFDPDSEDFFQNAQYEAFVDPMQDALPPTSLRPSESSSEASESSEIGDSDQAGPMALDWDINYRANARNSAWANHDTSSLIEPEWQPTIGAPVPISSSTLFAQSIPTFGTSSSDSSAGNSAPPPFIPPALFREPSPAIDADRNVRRTAAPASPTVRRTVSITPISVSVVRVDDVDDDVDDRSPSPRTPSPPSTPPVEASYPQHLTPYNAMLTPSPAPSVTPRFYTWDHHTGTSSSPTRIRAQQRDGPLTHPRARMSFARIEASPVAITTLGR